MENRKKIETVFSDNIKQEENAILTHSHNSKQSQVFQQSQIGSSHEQNSYTEPIDPSSNSGQNSAEACKWTQIERDFLFNCHSQLGNKWSIISSLIPGTTQNSVKNHFYSIMRAGFKKLNRYISFTKSRHKFKPINFSILSKLLIVADDRFERKLEIQESMINRCEIMKNDIYYISTSPDQVQKDIIEKTIMQLNSFNQQYRKKKKIRLFPKGTINVKKKKSKTNFKNINHQHYQKNISTKLRVQEIGGLFNGAIKQEPDLQKFKLSTFRRRPLRKRATFQQRSQIGYDKVQIISSVAQQIGLSAISGKQTYFKMECSQYGLSMQADQMIGYRNFQQEMVSSSLLNNFCANYRNTVMFANNWMFPISTTTHSLVEGPLFTEHRI